MGIKRYYKIIDSKTIFATNRIELGDKQIINPTHDQYLEAGWLEFIDQEPSYSELLRQAIQRKLSEIDIYDQSEAVNSFILNNEPVWLSAETRSNYRVSIEAAELLGETNITFQIGNIEATVPLDTAKLMLAQIQRYADACFLVTARHKVAVEGLATVKEIEAYDFKSGYPDKQSFNL